MPLRDVLLALVVVAIWGFNFVVIKLSVEALPPILAVALRFALAAFPAILFFRPPKTSFWYVAGFGLAFGFGLYCFLNVALFLGMPAGLGSVVLQVQGFFTMMIAFFVLKERPRPIQIAGALVAFAGIGVIASARWQGAALLPLLLTLGAAMSWAVANVVSKAAGKVNPIAITVWGSAIACVPLFAVSFATEGTEALVQAFVAPTWQVWALILFLAYPATLFGLAVWNYLLSKHPATLVAPFTLLVPITGLLSGYLVLGEVVSPVELAGGALVVAGLGVTVLKRRRGDLRISSAPPESQVWTQPDSEQEPPR